MYQKVSSEIFRCRGLFFKLAGIVLFFSMPVLCSAEDTVLLLQQSPPEGGRISPGIGLHYFDRDAQVTLTAIPKPGYQFVCWFGDVSESASRSTIAYMDAPKIIVAVFERVEYEEFELFEASSNSRPGQGLIPAAADYVRQGGGGAGGGRPRKWRWPEPEPEEPEQPDDFPVPEEGNDFPVPEPIPEPGTVFLLMAGSLFVKFRQKVV